MDNFEHFLAKRFPPALFVPRNRGLFCPGSKKTGRASGATELEMNQQNFLGLKRKSFADYLTQPRLGPMPEGFVEIPPSTGMDHAV